MLVRRRAQGLGQDAIVIDAQRKLASVRAHDDALNAKQIAEIDLQQPVESLLAEDI